MAKEELRIWEAVDAKNIAEGLIPKYHEHLEQAKILYLFTNQERKKCDRVRLAGTAKVSGLTKYLSSLHLSDDLDAPAVGHGADFVILFDGNIWERLTQAQRLALVDHELCHAGWVADEDDGRFILRGHDLEEFVAVVERHGLWKSDVAMMDTVMRQLPLPLTQPEGGEGQGLIGRVLDRVADEVNAGALDEGNTQVSATVHRGGSR